MPNIDLSILNQRQTPAFYADVFANRPAAGYVGRIFVSTDTFAFYRDNGTGWDLIGGPGTGTITGSGTAGTVPLWNGASTIGNSTLLEGTTKFTTTKDIQADAFYLNGMTAGSGALYWTSDRVTLANYNPTGTVVIEVAGGSHAQLIAADLSTTFYGNIIRNGGTSSQFLKADGSLDSNTYNTGSGAAGQVSYFNGTNSITGSNDLFWNNVNGHLGVNTNVPGTALDVHHDQNTVAILNQTTATNDVRIGFQNNGVGLWRIGAFYNAGANDFGIFDAVGNIQPVTVKKTTGQVLIGTSTVGSGKLVVASATGDNGIQIVGATAPSLRIDNAESGPTKRAGFGISTATNNFIQGSADRDFCMFNGSTTASPILFGIYGTTNVQEAARISAARNLLVGTTTDAGQKVQINGDISLISGGDRIININDTTGNLFQIQAAGNILYYSARTSGGSLAFRTNGTNDNKFTITSDGTVLVNANTSTYGAALGYSFGVRGTNTQTLISMALANQTLNTQGSYIGLDGTMGYINMIDNKPWTFGTNDIERLRILANGEIRITSNGTTIGSTLEFVSGAAGSDGSSLSVSYLGSGSYGPMKFSTSGGEKMRIAPSGNLLIGTTTDAGQKLQVNGNIVSQSTGNPFFGSQRNGGNQYGFYSDGAGSLILVDFGVAVRGNFNMGTGVYTATSDINKKKDFELSNLGLDAILGLKPTLYRMKEDKENTNKYLGFIAQEVKEFIPQSFVEKEDFIGLDYQPIIATLVKAIQELNTKIENLKN